MICFFRVEVVLMPYLRGNDFNVDLNLPRDAPLGKFPLGVSRAEQDFTALKGLTTVNQHDTLTHAHSGYLTFMRAFLCT